MKKKIIVIFIIMAVLLVLFSMTASALTKDEVQNKVNASSKQEVSGNIFIWFLCAMAFLKISQKIDSFMSSLGINVRLTEITMELYSKPPTILHGTGNTHRTNLK